VSWRASAYVKDLRQCPNGELMTRNEKLVALVLADNHQDKVNVHTFPSVDVIAADSLMSKRECQRLLGSLERKGVIVRERPTVQYRGVTTFYVFPELEPLPAPKAATDVKEGCQTVTLNDVQKPSARAAAKPRKRVTEGCQKGDTGRTAYKEEQEHEQKQKQETPKPPQAGADGFESPVIVARKGPATSPAQDSRVDLAVEQVIESCGFVELRNARNQRPGRLRRVLALVIRQEAERGEHTNTAALSMIAAWKDYLAQAELLSARYGPRKFYETGAWRNPAGWHWNPQAANDSKQLAAASVGVYRG